MTPVLRELHWLPIRRRIAFKTAVLASTVRLCNICGLVLWVDVNVHWPSSPAFFTDETAGRS